ncbi:GTPase [Protaetiibacter intestinalis]|uniref:DUF697 domain-containing protein n=1 Tax=Protaetiibacter intestinalis TaxID=2419774 RepID=A0A387B8P8_9MICO|nr:GTPase [Protaetiibacter intestinalis]AYF98737.1 DUF697 domain-containing protein [Protaetiibacter intestinalis]
MSSEPTEPIDTWFETQFREKYQEHADKLGRFNLAIFGKTGVGKSTLINAVFGEDVAATGIGRPVTMDSHLYLSSADFLGIYDTRGVEIGDDSDTIIKALEELIHENRKKPLSDQIHAAWYCVRAMDRRFEPTEAEFIRRLGELDLPVIVVLTQVPARDGQRHAHAIAMADEIAKENLPIEGEPIMLMAMADEFTGQTQHGLEELLDATFRVVPEAVRDALIAAQKIDLARKRTKATTAIGAAIGTAGGIGGIPIPFSDALLLAPLQVGLIASISAIYGIKPDKAAMAATLMPVIATNAGKAAVVGLLKLIPVGGSIVGGIISGVTAGAITGAIGYAWAAVCERLVEGGDEALDGDALGALFNAEFLSQFTKLMPAKTTAK